MNKHLIFLAHALLPACLVCTESLADNSRTADISKRIEVYSISQNYWDVIPGETLGEIVKQLLPDNQAKRDALLQQIVSLNPHAFADNQADKLRANVRLWLPNHSPIIRNSRNTKLYESQSFSWGQTYKAKR